MKKTRQTTSDTLSMKRIVGGVWAFVFFVAALLCIVCCNWRNRRAVALRPKCAVTAPPAKCNARAMVSRCGRDGRVGSEKSSGKAHGNCPLASSRNRRPTPCWRAATGAGANFPSAAICRWTGERRVVSIRHRPEKSSSRRSIRSALVAGGRRRYFFRRCL